MTAATADVAADAERLAAEFRYGLVAFTILALVLFEIAAPDATWARTISVLMAGGALTVAVATSSATGPVRHRRAGVAVAATLVVAAATVVGLSPAITFAALTLLVAAIPVTLAGGLLRLVRQRGVTGQAISGGLAIYLLAGLLFASVIAFVAHVQSGPYFTQGSHVPSGVRLYYSFTVLTTTGFGDFTAATGVGHALAVLDMLTGQLYLVTVVGVLIGNFTGRRK